MISNRIVELRRKHGMSQSQLAKALNISASTEGMYEQGRRIPGLDTLIMMSKIFAVSLDYLITGTEFQHTNADKQWEQIALDCPCRTCYWKSEVIKFCK